MKKEAKIFFPAVAIPLEGAPCFNCGTVLQGGWCHRCGQSAHDYHRSAGALAGEAFESFFHADGRLWRTLRRLVLQPARLTRDYLAGKRAPQIPPLRLFLVVLLILFLIGGWAARGVPLLKLEHPQAEMQKALDSSHVHTGISPAFDEWATDWLHAHAGQALEHPEDLVTAMRANAETFVFLMLPLSALILAGIFVFRRGFVLFDHLVFSMHSLSFAGLLISVQLFVQGVLGGNLGPILFAAPVHLFIHMRGVYGTSIVGTLIRMLVLFVASCLVVALLAVGLVMVGLEGLHA